MDSATIFDTVTSLVITTLISALVVWIVGKLNLGITLRNPGTAILAAILIAVFTTIFNFVLALILVALNVSLGSGLVAASVGLVVAAVVLLASGKVLSGMEVDGFLGALIAAVAITVLNWLVGLALVASGITAL